MNILTNYGIFKIKVNEYNKERFDVIASNSDQLTAIENLLLSENFTAFQKNASILIMSKLGLKVLFEYCCSNIDYHKMMEHLKNG